MWVRSILIFWAGVYISGVAICQEQGAGRQDQRRLMEQKHAAIQTLWKVLKSDASSESKRQHLDTFRSAQRDLEAQAVEFGALEPTLYQERTEQWMNALPKGTLKELLRERLSFASRLKTINKSPDHRSDPHHTHIVREFIENHRATVEPKFVALEAEHRQQEASRPADPIDRILKAESQKFYKTFHTATMEEKPEVIAKYRQAINQLRQAQREVAIGSE